MTKREAMRLLGAVLALFFFSNNTFPQGTQSGGISGSVADPAGAAVVGASVTIVNDATKNVERTAVTTAGGLFSATLLPPGDYTVIIKAPGFKVFTAKMPVLLNQTARLDAKLEVGAVTDGIEETANATQVNTESAVTGQPIDSATLQALPLPVPNFMFLLSLSAGTAGEFNHFFTPYSSMCSNVWPSTPAAPRFALRWSRCDTSDLAIRRSNNPFSRLHVSIKPRIRKLSFASA